MSGSIIQHAVTEPNPPPGTPLTLAFGSNVTAGNAIVVFAANLNGGTVSFGTCTDNHSDAFSALSGCAITDATRAVSMKAYAAFGVAGGATTVQVPYSGSPNLLTLYLFEVSGVGGFDAGSASTGTTTTASTTSFTTTHASDLCIATTLQESTSAGAGTGFTLIEITAAMANCLEFTTFASSGSHTATAQGDGSNQVWGINAATFFPASSGAAKNAILFGTVA